MVETELVSEEDRFRAYVEFEVTDRLVRIERKLDRIVAELDAFHASPYGRLLGVHRGFLHTATGKNEDAPQI